MHPVALRQPPHILARGNDRSASLANLAGSVCLVAFRFEVLQLRLRAVVLFDLLLGAVLGVPGQGTLGLLPHSLFLAVLGRYGHRVLDRKSTRLNSSHL